jgi:hypothetical protein
MPRLAKYALTALPMASSAIQVGDLSDPESSPAVLPDLHAFQIKEVAAVSYQLF